MSAQQQTMLDTKEITRLLIKAMGVHEGHFMLSVEFAFTAGNVGPSPEQAMPGAIMGISRIGIVACDAAGPNTVDAAEANPKKAARAKK